MLGKRIKRSRAAAGLSMAELGKRVGVSANMIKKYEHDESMPDFVAYRKLSQELGLPRGALLRSVGLELSGIEYRKRAKIPRCGETLGAAFARARPIAASSALRRREYHTSIKKLNLPCWAAPENWQVYWDIESLAQSSNLKHGSRESAVT